jgi:CheY-like chemotaxis protein
MLTQREHYKPLVLCVDDDEGILNLTREGLECMGYRVLTANSGEAALQTFAASPVDAVVLDYEMPGMNGSEVARQMVLIKPHVPKLLCSGKTGISGEETRAFQGYCAKPVGLFALVSKIGAMTSFAASV